MIKTLAVALLGPALALAAHAQTTAFRFEPDRLRPGTVYHYVKSNIDGTRAGDIALYVVSEDAIESFKYHDGATEATLVRAELDWSSFTVRRFESWRLSAEGDDVLRAELERVEGRPELSIRVGESAFVAPIEHWPWHSYDFDFASLGIAFRYLVDPDAPFTVGIADVNRGGEGPPFHDKGTVTVEPLGDEVHAGVPCTAYAVDGPGLDNRGGTIWIARDGAYMVGYEIALPDEPGFDSGKLRLRSIETKTAQEWNRFKEERIGR